MGNQELEVNMFSFLIPGEKRDGIVSNEEGKDCCILILVAENIIEIILRDRMQVPLFIIGVLVYLYLIF